MKISRNWFVGSCSIGIEANGLLRNAWEEKLLLQGETVHIRYASPDYSESSRDNCLAGSQRIERSAGSQREKNMCYTSRNNTIEFDNIKPNIDVIRKHIFR